MAPEQHEPNTRTFEVKVASNSSAMADFIMCTTASPTVTCQNAFPGCVSETAFYVVFFLQKGFFLFKVYSSVLKSIF